MTPVEKERKSVIDFCVVYTGKEAVPLKHFLAENQFEQEKLGLSAITHLRDCYNLYYSNEFQYQGVSRKENANDVCLSSIPKDELPVGLLYFNKDAYSIYCKKYKEYWEWVEKRNEDRFNTTMAHGKKYDSKNMMHVFRLLLMAKEIATEGKINVRRNDREFLLSIKEGKFEYDELVERAESMKNELSHLYQQSNLSEEPNIEKINQLLVKMREVYYAR